MAIAIRVEDLSKSYIIRHNGERYTSLRETITNKVQKTFRQTKNVVINNSFEKTQRKEEFWALHGINFEVQQGERIGIIGRNGAGKSTLLKILSRITEPTSGRISTKGRIASLLEVGTGFHPELTGRENIYLNGAILGMHRAEIKSKFDEIVAFSEVEKFLDTPVKRYSSGMYVRLAFAVAAFLESEILIIDEVLAVGDAEFQKKCLGKMNDISKEGGRTILFVSHNMQAISNLCNRVILINKGIVIQDAETSKVVQNYLMFETVKNGILEWDNENALGDSTIKLKSIKILDQNNNIRNHFFSKSGIRVQLDFDILQLNNELVIGFDLTNEDGITVLRSYQNDSNSNEWPKLVEGKNSICCDIPGELLNLGTYYLSPKISIHCQRWIIDSDPLLSFDVELNHGVSPFWNVLNKANKPGLLALIIPWKNV